MLRRFYHTMRLISIIAALAATTCYAYQNDAVPPMGFGKQAGAHSAINRLALQQFINTIAPNDKVFRRYDFTPTAKQYKLDNDLPVFFVEADTVIERGDWYPDQKVPYVPTWAQYSSYTYKECKINQPFPWWVKEGGFSADEPETWQALRHFYDPCALSRDDYDRGNLVSYLTDDMNRTLAPWMSGFAPKVNAKDLALTGSPYSWKAGQESLDKAFAMGGSIPGKRAYFGNAWRALGECMHLLADMGLPAHVRNDAHPAVTPKRIEDVVNFKGDPYEVFADAGQIEIYGNGSGDPLAVKIINAAKTPEQLYQKLAEYTNTNFFSIDTISGIDAVSKKEVHSFNGQPDYPSPKLEQYRFEPAPGDSGKNGAGWYVDADGQQALYRYASGKYSICEMEQAKQLIPAVVSANAKLIGMFLPRIGVKIDSYDPKTRTLSCRVVEFDENGSARPSTKFINGHDNVLLVVQNATIPVASRRDRVMVASTSMQIPGLGGLTDKIKDIGKEIGKAVDKAKDQIDSATKGTKPADKPASQPEKQKAPVDSETTIKPIQGATYWLPVSDNSPAAFKVSLPGDITIPDGSEQTGAAIILTVGVDMGGILVKSNEFTLAPIRIEPEATQTEASKHLLSLKASPSPDPVSVQWQFGDDTPMVKIDGSYDASHTYKDDGRYTVTCMALDTVENETVAQGIGLADIKKSNAPTVSADAKPKVKPDIKPYDPLTSSTLAVALRDICLLGWDGSLAEDQRGNVYGKTKHGFTYEQYGRSGDEHQQESLMWGWHIVVAQGELHRLEDKDGYYSNKTPGDYKPVAYPYVAIYHCGLVGANNSWYTTNLPYFEAHAHLGNLEEPQNAKGQYPQVLSEAAQKATDGNMTPVALGDAAYANETSCLAVRGPVCFANHVELTIAFLLGKGATATWSTGHAELWDAKNMTKEHGWQDAEPFLTNVKQWFAGRSKAAQDVCASEIADWDAWCGPQIADGNGFRGAFAADVTSFFPKPNEIAEGTTMQGQDGRYPWENEYKPVSSRQALSDRYAVQNKDTRQDIMLDITAFPWKLDSFPTEDCKKKFTEWAALLTKQERITIPGADEAVQMTYRDAGLNIHKIIMRKANVLVVINGREFDQKAQAPIQNVTKLASLITARIRAVSAAKGK